MREVSTNGYAGGTDKLTNHAQTILPHNFRISRIGASKKTVETGTGHLTFLKIDATS